MELKKIVLVRSRNPSFWTSCTFLTQNLENLYKDLYQDRVSLLYNDDNLSDWELYKEVESVNFAHIERLVFIDHYPSYTRFIKAIDHFCTNENLCIDIHAFGDFTFYAQEYLQIEDILKKFKIKILAPSMRAKKFIEGHILGRNVVEEIPFSVNYPSLIDFTLARSKFGLSSEDDLICYAGRLSYEKNSLFLLDVMDSFLSKNDRSHFYLAGKIDNLCSNLFRSEETQLGFEDSFYKKLKDLQSKFGERVKYLGSLSYNHLTELYCASDKYISLSTYHNEDFGLAPLEAALCGCQLLLTDWGGYSNFSGVGSALIKVSLTSNGLDINKQEIFQKLLMPKTKREEIISFYQNKFSQDSIKQKIQKVQNLEKEFFPGFSEIPKMYFWINQGLVKLDQTTNSMYEKLYRSYYE